MQQTWSPQLHTYTAATSLPKSPRSGSGPVPATSSSLPSAEPPEQRPQSESAAAAALTSQHFASSFNDVTFRAADARNAVAKSGRTFIGRLALQMGVDGLYLKWLAKRKLEGQAGGTRGTRKSREGVGLGDPSSRSSRTSHAGVVMNKLNLPGQPQENAGRNVGSNVTDVNGNAHGAEDRRVEYKPGGVGGPREASRDGGGRERGGLSRVGSDVGRGGGSRASFGEPATTTTVVASSQADLISTTKPANSSSSPVPNASGTTPASSVAAASAIAAFAAAANALETMQEQSGLVTRTPTKHDAAELPEKTVWRVLLGYRQKAAAEAAAIANPLGRTSSNVPGVRPTRHHHSLSTQRVGDGQGASRSGSRLGFRQDEKSALKETREEDGWGAVGFEILERMHARMLAGRRHRSRSVSSPFDSRRTGSRGGGSVSTGSNPRTRATSAGSTPARVSRTGTASPAPTDERSGSRQQMRPHPYLRPASRGGSPNRPKRMSGASPATTVSGSTPAGRGARDSSPTLVDGEDEEAEWKSGAEEGQEASSQKKGGSKSPEKGKLGGRHKAVAAAGGEASGGTSSPTLKDGGKKTGGEQEAR